MPSRTFAIGDIHGCLIPFDALLSALNLTPEDHLILLGDYIDRGPDSAGVISRILRLSKLCRLSPLKGNHEQMLLEARDDSAKLRDWRRNGGDTTLRSYNGIRATLRDIPPDHWHFLTHSLLDYLETDTHLFVHASAYPDMPLADQPDYILRWERCDTIAPHDSGKPIICGHTPQREGRPLNKGYAICLDTHSYAGGPLSCLNLTTGALLQSSPTGHLSRSHISDYET